MLFFEWGRGLATLLLFLYVTEEAGRKYVWDMPWPPAAECNMITNKQSSLQLNCSLLVESVVYHLDRDSLREIKFSYSLAVYRRLQLVNAHGVTEFCWTVTATRDPRPGKRQCI